MGHQWTEGHSPFQTASQATAPGPTAGEFSQPLNLYLLTTQAMKETSLSWSLLASEPRPVPGTEKVFNKSVLNERRKEWMDE